MQSPKQADRIVLLGGLDCALSAPALAEGWHHRLATALHPPTVAATDALATPNSQLLYHLLCAPLYRGIQKQILRSLLPTHLPYFKAY